MLKLKYLKSNNFNMNSYCCSFKNSDKTEGHSLHRRRHSVWGSNPLLERSCITGWTYSTRLREHLEEYQLNTPLLLPVCYKESTMCNYYTPLPFMLIVLNAVLCQGAKLLLVGRAVTARCFAKHPVLASKKEYYSVNAKCPHHFRSTRQYYRTLLSS